MTIDWHLACSYEIYEAAALLRIDRSKLEWAVSVGIVPSHTYQGRPRVCLAEVLGAIDCTSGRDWR